MKGECNGDGWSWSAERTGYAFSRGVGERLDTLPEGKPAVHTGNAGTRGGGESGGDGGACSSWGGGETACRSAMHVLVRFNRVTAPTARTIAARELRREPGERWIR